MTEPDPVAGAMAAALRAALDGVCVLDRDLAAVDCNDAFAAALGTTRDEVLRGARADIRPRGRDGAVTFGEIARLGSWRGPADLQRVDGTTAAVELSCIHDDAGARFYCFLRDRTEINLRDFREREHHDALAHVARLATLGEMASGLAHEFNQPLAAIVNYANGSIRLLQRAGFEDPSVQRALESIVEQAARASDIIKRLRTFARRSADDLEPYLVSDIVVEAVELCGRHAARAGVRLETRLADGTDEVVVDGIKVEQVVMGLVLNAIEAVDGAAEPRVLVEVEAADGDRFVEVRVSDNGGGIDAETRTRIFEPFFSTRRHSGPSKGLGLGLSTARSTIEGHGGRLWLEERPEGVPAGHVTCFRFTLPRRHASMDSR